MNTPRNKYYILNFAFVLCVLTLIVNDHYLKYKFSNGLTGKLSDIAGIIILPLLISFILPKLKRYSLVISALLFIVWKSELSQAFINTYNTYAYIQTSRIVDYSDLYVLLLLPVPYYIIRNIDNLNCIIFNRVSPVLILLPTIFALLATAPPPRYYYTRTKGNLTCYKCTITVNYNQDEIIKRLQKADIAFDSIAIIDSVALQKVPRLKTENAHVYRLNQWIIDKDTLRNLDFTMRTFKNGKTKIHFNGMQVSDDIANLKLQTKLRNHYKDILFTALKNNLKE